MLGRRTYVLGEGENDDLLVDFGEMTKSEEMDLKTFRERRSFDTQLMRDTERAKKEIQELVDDDPLAEAIAVCKESAKIARVLAEGKIQDYRKLMFIKGYLSRGSLRGAMLMSGVSSSEYKVWMMGKTPENAVFKHVINECLDMMADVLEEEAFRLALSGNDRVLLKMLEGYRPERYAQKKQITHEGNVNVNISNWADLAKKAEAVIDVEGGTVDEENIIDGKGEEI